tara:strand:+ start:47 stop:496 length:450 start_codon:yes stop_codon:yes gene_type:complete
LKHFDRVGIYEYPEKYIIVTIDTLKGGGGIHTENITSVSKEIGETELSEIVIKHLNLSKSGVEKFDSQKAGKEFIKATGFKTIKAQMRNSKYISIDRNNGIYNVSLTKNGGTSGPKKGYQYTGERIEFESPKEIIEIGIKIKKGLELSE